MRRQGSTAEAPAPEAVEIEGQFFTDPFDIPASLSPKIPSSLYPWIFGTIRRKYVRLIRRGLRQPGIHAVLLCDRQLVGQAETAEQFEFDEVRRIEQEHDRACFVISNDDFVEECAWAPLRSDDAYPTVRVWIAPASTSEHELKDVGVEVVADFDTGNPRRPYGYNAFGESVREAAGIETTIHTEGVHVRGSYWFARLPARFGTTDERGAIRSHLTSVRFVKDWAASPFLKANPLRRGFVGREIMFALGLRIILDPTARRTRVEFA